MNDTRHLKGQLWCGGTVKSKLLWLAQRLKKGNKGAHDEVQRTDENVGNIETGFVQIEG